MNTNRKSGKLAWIGWLLVGIGAAAVIALLAVP